MIIDLLDLPLQNALRSLWVQIPHLRSGSGSLSAARVASYQLTASKNIFEKRQIGYRVIKAHKKYELVYDGVSDFIASFGMLVKDIMSKSVKQEHLIESDFKRVGVMFDVSRNAVMKVATVKKWICRLALLGYNQILLYTEDTYEIDGEPYFGYKRGRYSKSELKEIDEYCQIFGIELIPCIQTLGHLEQMLQWPHYHPIADIQHVLLAEAEASHAMIEKMLQTCQECFTSKRIHIGMDEAVGVGLGKYLDQHGHHSAYQIIIKHLNKVVELCRHKGLAPIIWSDMFFRAGSKTHDYYDLEVQNLRKLCSRSHRS